MKSEYDEVARCGGIHVRNQVTIKDATICDVKGHMWIQSVWSVIPHILS